MEYVVVFSDRGKTFQMSAVTLGAAKAIADRLKEAKAKDVMIGLRPPHDVKTRRATHAPN